MPTTVFTHLMGTLALLAIMMTVVSFMYAVAWMAFVETQKTRLSEIAEAVAREIVELASIHTLGEGGFTYMSLNIPKHLGGSGYVIRIYYLGNNVIGVSVSLQQWEVIKRVTLTGFKSELFRIVATTTQENGIVYGSELYMPQDKPIVIVKREGDNYYIGIGYIKS